MKPDSWPRLVQFSTHSLRFGKESHPNDHILHIWTPDFLIHQWADDTCQFHFWALIPLIELLLEFLKRACFCSTPLACSTCRWCTCPQHNKTQQFVGSLKPLYTKGASRLWEACFAFTASGTETCSPAKLKRQPNYQHWQLESSNAFSWCWSCATSHHTARTTQPDTENNALP